MVPAIPYDRLFARPNPKGDFIARRPEILLDPDFQEDESLRSEVIKANLNAAEPYVYSLGQVQHIRLPALSKWQICKYTARRLYVDELRADNVAVVVLAVAMCVFDVWLCKLGVSAIHEAKKKLAEGCWVVNSSRPYSQVDVTVTYVIVGMGGISWGLPALFLTAVLIFSIAERVHSTYRSIPKDVVHIQALGRNPSSAAAFANAHVREGEIIKDILSQEDLTKAEIQKPHKLVIGGYVADIMPMVRATLIKPCPKLGELPHPFENRGMT